MKLLILAPPAAGKGTQATLLSEYYAKPHLAFGDLLRQIVKEDSEPGLVIANKMNSGEFISDQLAWQIIKKHLEKNSNGFILEGFPRNVAQAQILEKEKVNLDAVVFLNVDIEELKKRHTNRLLCSKCGRNFTKKENDKCPDCLIPLTKRSDDKKDVFENRLRVYQKETEPLVDYYQKQGLLLNVDGNKKPVEIFQEITKVLDDKK